MFRVVLAWGGTALVICALSLACGPAPAASPTPDAFAVVRATSEAAFQAGQTQVARGNALQACIDFDLAKTNDPDGRADIQQALEQAVIAGCQPSPQSTAPSQAAQQRTLVVATIASGLGTALAVTSTPAVAVQVTSVVAGTPVVPTVPPTPVAAPPTAPPAPTSSASAAQLVTWTDPQGRFSIGAPADWTRVDQPQTLVGTGVVEFGDTSKRADIDVSVDTTKNAVSPELYAASLELAMQRQVPGYATEQIVPGTTAGSPSIRRVFTFTQRDSTGQDHQARGFQLVIVRGSTPYLISGTAPADMFEQFSPTFDQMVESFRFS